MRPTRAALLPFVAVAVMTVAACSDSEGGTPEAEGAPSSHAASSETAAPSSEDGAGMGTPLSGLDPCSLLGQADVTQFGPVDPPERKKIGTADTCSWTPDRSEVSGERGTIGVGFRENAGVQDMNDKGMGVQHTTENGRDYGRSPSPNGCTIAIGVTDTSRVDVVVSGADPDKACEMANTLVEVVEPKVPQG
ncbi:Protein of unknown function (DUF3558) [Prauserella sp. Am3]|nr:Protein of unknown function (DUF3558) [Prauserella sp. Am3]